jgi:hypothetical protein
MPLLDVDEARLERETPESKEFELELSRLLERNKGPSLLSGAVPGAGLGGIGASFQSRPGSMDLSDAVEVVGESQADRDSHDQTLKEVLWPILMQKGHSFVNGRGFNVNWQIVWPKIQNACPVDRELRFRNHEALNMHIRRQPVPAWTNYVAKAVAAYKAVPRSQSHSPKRRVGEDDDCILLDSAPQKMAGSSARALARPVLADETRKGGGSQVKAFSWLCVTVSSYKNTRIRNWS